MEMAYPNDLERAGEWRKMAERMHIPLDEDPQLKADRRKRVQADLEAMFGPMVAPGTTVEE
jgi:hypothetical protein